MKRSASKLLSIFLVFLLGLAPLQSLLADIHIPVDQDPMPCHTSVESSHFNLMSEQHMQDCDQCETASSCNDSCCSYSHCGSHVIALIPEFTTYNDLMAEITIFRIFTQLKTLQPPALFRPPRS